TTSLLPYDLVTLDFCLKSQFGDNCFVFKPNLVIANLEHSDTSLTGGSAYTMAWHGRFWMRWNLSCYDLPPGMVAERPLALDAAFDAIFILTNRHGDTDESHGGRRMRQQLAQLGAAAPANLETVDISMTDTLRL